MFIAFSQSILLSFEMCFKVSCRFKWALCTVRIYARIIIRRRIIMIIIIIIDNFYIALFFDIHKLTALYKKHFTTFTKINTKLA